MNGAHNLANPRQRSATELTRVGPNTLMGTFMRQYWIPAALSSELEPDGPPLRLILLGEKLVAFRDSTGRVGVLDHRCPHRCASLFLGRNEEGGLRCVYHGWKFDVSGRCLDMPNVSPEEQFAEKVKARAYPAVERGGLIFVYMGPRAKPPELPNLEVLNAPAHLRRIYILQRECNWLQALEGDIDSSHLGFLHTGALTPEDLGRDHPAYFTVSDRVPKFHVAKTAWGTSTGAYREGVTGETYWRVSNYLFPFYTQTANTRIESFAVANAWVPMDDTHTMMIRITAGEDEAAHSFAPVPMRNGKLIPGTEPQRYRSNTTDWFGRWRAENGFENDWGLDRELQRSGLSYCGIENINMQDQAVTESMGEIVDQASEHLCTGDRMITATRRRLLEAARDVAEGKTAPGLDEPSVYWDARGGTFTAPATANWLDACRDSIKSAIRWPDA
ncbi:phthalate 4,5-dioxygenase oxygenase subunit [Bradyrhizobium sp. USDA 4463]